MSATISALNNYEKYSYETTTINVADNWVKVYSDSISQGNSWSKKVEEGASQGFDCEIKKGDPHPYCIMLNWITPSEFQGLNLSLYKYMTIHGTYDSPSMNDFLRVSLRQFDLGYTQMNKVHTYKYNLIEIQRKNFKDEIRIDLSDLSVPFWWMSMMKGQKVDSFVAINNVPLIEVSTGTHATIGEHKLRISSFDFDREVVPITKVYEYILLVWGCFIFLILMIVSIYFAILLRTKVDNEKNLIQINTALSLRSAELEIFNKTDELTGVLNRAGMQNKMMDCMSQDVLPLTVVMVDLDHFKKINDRYGHQTGDVVLANLGELLNKFIKNDESVSRFGGEEFMILMPNQTFEMVKERIEALRVEIETYDMPIDKPVTASFGVATSIYRIEFKQLIEKADNALYVAKNNGRNCIKHEGD
ncbi:GGDEF domain-containing protein [Marinicellulosiphila megalodicopiae]|uniref:GGDEF domain-containing protein n=1 Tax=Marinicellulosiphila megalodicopiae TaxID=2724896 RepID=UPI003BB042EF